MERIKRIIASIIVILVIGATIGVIGRLWWEFPRVVTLMFLGAGAFLWALWTLDPPPGTEDDDGLDTEPYREDEE